MSHDLILALLVLVPLVAAAVALFMPRPGAADVRAIAVFLSLIPLALAVYAFFGFSPDKPWTFNVHWLTFKPVEQPAILTSTFYLRLDGINVLLVLLTGILTPVVLIGSWST